MAPPAWVYRSGSRRPCSFTARGDRGCRGRNHIPWQVRALQSPCGFPSSPREADPLSAPAQRPALASRTGAKLRRPIRRRRSPGGRALTQLRAPVSQGMRWLSHRHMSGRRTPGTGGGDDHRLSCALWTPSAGPRPSPYSCAALDPPRAEPRRARGQDGGIPSGFIICAGSSLAGCRARANSPAARRGM